LFYLENLKCAGQTADLVLEREHYGVVGVFAIHRDLVRSHRSRRAPFNLHGETQ
jgi:hypothetical protein